MNIKDVNEIKGYGKRLTREEMSELVIKAVDEFNGKSYKGAMQLAGKLKAIALAAQADDYWTEQVNKGFTHEQYEMRRHISMSKV